MKGNGMAPDGKDEKWKRKDKRGDERKRNGEETKRKA